MTCPGPATRSQPVCRALGPPRAAGTAAAHPPASLHGSPAPVALPNLRSGLCANQGFSFSLEGPRPAVPAGSGLLWAEPLPWGAHRDAGRKLLSQRVFGRCAHWEGARGTCGTSLGEGRSGLSGWSDSWTETSGRQAPLAGWTPLGTAGGWLLSVMEPYVGAPFNTWCGGSAPASPAGGAQWGALRLNWPLALRPLPPPRFPPEHRIPHGPAVGA
uniref:Uncharacterized protein n=1 Tax=Molossus molossus TaxID=27622 RepID=A0A7J8EF47_MOLMO|nr:hypothetical protein HJG59_008799 [Molossus molossus]